jgi:hypothetical protein
MSIPWKKIYPHIIAVVSFLVITLVYFYPMLEGKVLQQSDMMKWEGGAKEVLDYHEEKGENILWTGSMFSGMPSYQIHVYDSNPLRGIVWLLKGGMSNPGRFLFLYMIGFYILLASMRIKPWLSISGAVAFGFSTYFIIILGVGHLTKAHALGYVPMVLAGVFLLYRGKYLAGAALTTLSLALQVLANHYQITYYMLLIIVFYGIAELFHAVKQKTLPQFMKASVIILLAGIIALLANINKLYTTYSYSSETTRGDSELTLDANNKTTGLDRDYATAWSYGVQETLSLMIPNVKGGGNARISENEKALDKVDRNVRSIVGNFDHYWGKQPFTAGPVYVGAFVFFLFILSLFVLKGPMKWGLLAVTIFSVLLAWGSNFMAFTDLMLDYLPGYNKFRTVSMALVIAEVTIPLMGFLALAKIIHEPAIIKKRMKSFYISLGLTAGVILLLIALPELFLNFTKPDEAGIFNNWRNSGATPAQVAEVKENLLQARLSIFSQDAWRSLLYILAGAAVIYLYLIKKLKENMVYVLVFAIIFLDLFTINKRYLDNDMFVKESRTEANFTPSTADNIILQDEDPHFRVLNLSVSTFNDSFTSYFHKSIGGYHGAKLGRYQDMIEYNITPEMEKLTTSFNSGNMDNVFTTLESLQVLNMLNTRYIILDPSRTPFKNPYAYGNAWFVGDYQLAENANQEILSLRETNLRNRAVVDRRFDSYLDENPVTFDSAATITLDSYHPEHLTYTAKTTTNNLAVFSEVYYDKGWNAYIDGEPAEYIRVNYILRGMAIPAGEHTVEFKFEPEAFYVTRAVSYVAGSLVILFFITAMFLYWRKNRKTEEK